MKTILKIILTLSFKVFIRIVNESVNYYIHVFIRTSKVFQCSQLFLYWEPEYFLIYLVLGIRNGIRNEFTHFL